ncbi:uncharacterized protein LOC100887840 [Strongylocentrotus purpuratus]|uniref:Uncharacterized protein n=1 Tax=Strongylocentrotus purpuratus TaxID=7668 RepID=A0A7M7GHH4_STRPU|nr:uncharacterized protein LOC100887840 [Strongylocentrotus purpuratus]|eukprot:XP_003727377.1 PREDICTED: uncharacterized protein LOC100887840 [Strongylocentrotus purpuratus]
MESPCIGSEMAECTLASKGRAARDGGSRTIIWCVPRSVSTALTKCLSFIEGIQVWFEPYAYCRNTRVIIKQQLDLDLPTEYEGNEEIYKRMTDHFRETGQSNVTRQENLSYASIGRFLDQSVSRHVLVKDMALTPDEYKFLPKGFKHIFLIRHPLRVYNSLRKSVFALLSARGMLKGESAVEETFDIRRDSPFRNTGDSSHKYVYDMWKYVKENLGSETIVVDSDDLLTNPAELLPKICRAAGLPYDESLLKWDGSSEVTKSWMVPSDYIVENMVYFFDRAIMSSEFLPASKMPSRDDVRPDVIRCTDQAMKFYDEMYEVRIQV